MALKILSNKPLVLSAVPVNLLCMLELDSQLKLLLLTRNGARSSNIPATAGAASGKRKYWDARAFPRSGRRNGSRYVQPGGKTRNNPATHRDPGRLRLMSAAADHHSPSARRN